LRGGGAGAKKTSQEVRVAGSGPAAIAEAKRYHPDLVLLDIGLPGMDGYRVARRLRQAGFDHHLVKPVDLDTLRTLLASCPHR
jgi:CheY-like chemotaxis protein